MENKTVLLLSYGELKEMLDDFQFDGLWADGHGAALHLDPAREIRKKIKRGEIEVFKKQE